MADKTDKVIEAFRLIFTLMVLGYILYVTAQTFEYI